MRQMREENEFSFFVFLFGGEVAGDNASTPEIRVETLGLKQCDTSLMVGTQQRYIWLM